MAVVSARFDRLGAIVQVNQLMFEPGQSNSPGVVIYSPQPRWGDTLESLMEMPHRLFELKEGGGQTKEERVYGAELADETGRAMGLKMPKSMTGGADIRSTVVVFHRKHLPGRYLASGFFPLLIHPDTDAVVVVPGRYWPQRLINQWSN